MTVQDLIDFLARFDPNVQVYVQSSDGRDTVAARIEWTRDGEPVITT